MSTATAHLVELVQQVRGRTLQVLEQVPPAWQLWAPAGTSNHILWHAGHILWAVDILCVEPLTGRSQLPAKWDETFGQDCRPVRETKEWPPLEQIRSLLQSQGTELIAAIQRAPQERLFDDQVLASGWDLPRGIIHGLHDEARHQGEMHLLIKLCRAAGIQ